MLAVLMALLIYIVFAQIIAELLSALVPLLLDGLAWLIAWLFRIIAYLVNRACRFVWELLMLACTLLVNCLMHAVRGGWEVLVFLYFLAAETLNAVTDRTTTDGNEETEEDDRGFDGDAQADSTADDDAPPDPYAVALHLLGLSPGFTREEFNRAYKCAIAKAHPDKGGSHLKAIAVNQARKLIMNHNGWKR